MSWGECVENECGQRAQHKSVNNREGVRKRSNPRGGHCTYAARIKYITYIIRAHIYSRCTHYYIISHYIYTHSRPAALQWCIYSYYTDRQAFQKPNWIRKTDPACISMIRLQYKSIYMLHR